MNGVPSGKLLDLTADRYPDKTAVVQGDRRLSYADWNEDVDSLANGFLELGLRPSDHVAVSMGNRIEFFTAFFAGLKIGCTLVPIPSEVPPDRLRFFLDSANVNGLCYDETATESVKEIRTDIDVSIFVGTDDASSNDVTISALVSRSAADRPNIGGDGDDGYCVWYTSGSTGDPKAVYVTHDEAMHRFIRQTVNHDYTPTDVDLPIAPFYHVLGTEFHAIPMFMIGGTVVFMQKFDPTETLELIESEGVTIIAGVPTQFKRLLQEDVDAYDLSSLAHLHYAGEPMSRPVTERCMEELTDQVFQGYGSTEVHDATLLRPKDAVEKIGSCGLPTFGTEICLVEPRSGDDLPPPNKTVDRGEVGELIVSTGERSVADEYWRNKAATRATFRDGWFYTGDVAYRDEDGFVYIEGRVDHMILSGGEKIYPREVEEVLQTHPDVVDVGIIGVDDDEWGQRVKAVVVTTGTPGEADLDRYCLDHDELADWKRPREYDFVDNLPKTASNKVDRERLG
jgi:acyl-CoA synthetase (AMP-forming)/AMP-acid ligase II